jgi:glycosyltransferase involved in cell wall biosynthesis
LQRYRQLGFSAPMLAGDIYCAGAVIRPPLNRPVTKIGYMGFDHAHDLALILPAIVTVLRKNPSLSFELFGSIPKPAALEEFGERVTLIPPVKIYAEFLEKFATLNWDIGLCPLATTPFNRVKANTKWVEYTSVGAAVIATRGMAYDDCCAAGCGELAETPEEWVAALENLCNDKNRRYQMVAAAQARLQREYTDDALREQILTVIQRARELHIVSTKGAAVAAVNPV